MRNCLWTLLLLSLTSLGFCQATPVTFKQDLTITTAGPQAVLTENKTANFHTLTWSGTPKACSASIEFSEDKTHWLSPVAAVDCSKGGALNFEAVGTYLRLDVSRIDGSVQLHYFGQPVPYAPSRH